MSAIVTKAQYDTAMKVTRQLRRRNAASVVSAMAERATVKTSARVLEKAYRDDLTAPIGSPSKVGKMLTPKHARSVPNAYVGTRFRRAG